MPYADPVQQALERDRRYALAQQMLNIAPHPQTGFQAVAQGLGSILSNVNQNELQQEYGARDDAYRKALAGLLSGDQSGMQNQDLQQQLAPLYLQQMFSKKTAEPFTLGEGDVRFDANGNIIAEGKKKPDKPANIQTVQRGDKVDIYKDGEYVKTEPVAAKPDTVLRLDQSHRQGKLPTPALKMQQEELDTIGAMSSINADLSAFKKQVDSGQLDLGPVSNLLNKARNFTGFSSDESKNLASFQSTLERLRNDSLRLNKGVQTEGDAQRAWNELLANINDPGLVSQRLEEIQRINERAANIRKMNVEQIRQNFGVEPLDTSGYSQQMPAVGSPTGFRILRKK